MKKRNPSKIKKSKYTQKKIQESPPKKKRAIRRFGVPTSLSKTFHQPRMSSTGPSTQKKTLFFTQTLDRRRKSFSRRSQNTSLKSSKTRGFRSPSLANPKFYTAKKTKKEVDKGKKEVVPNSVKKSNKLRSKSNKTENGGISRIQKKMRNLRKMENEYTSIFQRYSSVASRGSFSRVSSLTRKEMKNSYNPKKGKKFNKKRKDLSISIGVKKKFKILKNENSEKLKKNSQSVLNEFQTHFDNSKEEIVKMGKPSGYGLLNSIKKKFVKHNFRKEKNMKLEKSKEKKNKNPQKIIEKIIPKKKKISIIGQTRGAKNRRKRKKSPRDFLKNLMSTSKTGLLGRYGLKKSRSPKSTTKKMFSKKNFKKSKKPERFSQIPISKWKNDEITGTGISNLKKFRKIQKIKSRKKIEKKKILNAMKSLKIQEKKLKFRNKDVTKSTKSLKNFQNFDQIEFNLNKKTSRSDSVIIFGFSPFYTSKLKLRRKFLKMRKEVKEIRNPIDKFDILQVKFNKFIQSRKNKNLEKIGKKSEKIRKTMKKIEENRKDNNKKSTAESPQITSPLNSSLNETDPLFFQQKLENEELENLEKSIDLNFKKEINNSLFNSFEELNETSSSSEEDTESEETDSCLISEERKKMKIKIDRVEDLTKAVPIVDYFLDEQDGDQINLNKYSPAYHVENRLEKENFGYPDLEPVARDKSVPDSPIINARNFDLEGPAMPSLPRGFPSYYAEEKNMKKFLKELSPLDSRILEVSAEYCDEVEPGLSQNLKISEEWKDVKIENKFGKPEIIKEFDKVEETPEAENIEENSLIYKKNNSQKKLQNAKDPFKDPERHYLEEDHNKPVDFFDLTNNEKQFEEEILFREKNPEYVYQELHTVTEEETEDNLMESSGGRGENIFFKNKFILEKSQENLDATPIIKELNMNSEFNDTSSMNENDTSSQKNMDEKIKKKILENKKKIHILEKYLSKMDNSGGELGSDFRGSESGDSKEGYFCDFHSDSFKVGRVEIRCDKVEEGSYFKEVLEENFFLDFYDEFDFKRNGKPLEFEFYEPKSGFSLGSETTAVIVFSFLDYFYEFFFDNGK